MDLLERTALLDELDGRMAAAARGGCIVLVGGEARIGKSAVVRRFGERHVADVRFLLGACDPLLTPRPLGAVHDIARQTGGRRGRYLPVIRPRPERAQVAHQPAHHLVVGLGEEQAQRDHLADHHVRG